MYDMNMNKYDYEYEHAVLVYILSISAIFDTHNSGKLWYIAQYIMQSYLCYLSYKLKSSSEFYINMLMCLSYGRIIFWYISEHIAVYLYLHVYIVRHMYICIYVYMYLPPETESVTDMPSDPWTSSTAIVIINISIIDMKWWKVKKEIIEKMQFLCCFT